MDITNLSLEQLEALAYRLWETAAQNEHNLNILRQQIAKKRAEVKPPEAAE